MTKRYWNIHLEEMIKARVHLGYNKRRWNPKIAPFILAGSQHTRKATHITNLVKTARFLSEACDLLFNAASQAKNILMVGTMPQKVANLVKLAAIRARCHYVSRKWLRGTLTNWLVTMLRLKNLKNLKISKKRGRFQSFRKRDASILRKKLSILQKFFGGIQYMKGLPDIVVLIDLEHEYIVLQECHLLGIPTICVIDTNCDPDLADLPIPANTKDHISIRWILNKLVLAIREGHSSYIERKKSEKKKKK